MTLHDWAMKIMDSMPIDLIDDEAKREACEAVIENALSHAQYLGRNNVEVRDGSDIGQLRAENERLRIALKQIADEHSRGGSEECFPVEDMARAALEGK